jgi:hypothetical protein
MVENISMNINDTLELDYLVEQIDDSTIDITDEPSKNSYSLDYGRKQFGIFDPTDTGTYKLDINGQTIEIEVTDIPDSGADHQWNFVSGSGTTVNDQNGSLDANFSGLSWGGSAGAGDTFGLLDGVDDSADLGSTGVTELSHWTENGKGTTLMWINPDDSTNAQGVFGAGSPGASLVGFGTQIFNGNFRAFLSNGTSNTVLSSSINTDEWQAWAAVADGSDFIWYKATPGNNYDITQVDSESVKTTTDSWTNNPYFGFDPTASDRYFDGGFDIIFNDITDWTVSELQSFVDDTKEYYQ